MKIERQYGYERGTDMYLEGFLSYYSHVNYYGSVSFYDVLSLSIVLSFIYFLCGAL